MGRDACVNLTLRESCQCLQLLVGYLPSMKTYPLSRSRQPLPVSSLLRPPCTIVWVIAKLRHKVNLVSYSRISHVVKRTLWDPDVLIKWANFGRCLRHHCDGEVYPEGLARNFQGCSLRVQRRNFDRSHFLWKGNQERMGRNSYPIVLQG